jgi:hypothetical protein
MRTTAIATTASTSDGLNADRSDLLSTVSI